MSDKETLHFKIGLSSSSDKKKPRFIVSLNEKQYIDSQITTAANTTDFFEFEAEINEGDCVLTIEFVNKTVHDTVLDSTGNIVDDLLLNIESIEIDDIDLGSLLWTASDYKPNYPEVYKKQIASEGKELQESVKNCVNLGWNGKWILPFRSPFYIWLLENI